jgi:hypothetical protein
MSLDIVQPSFVTGLTECARSPESAVQRTDASSPVLEELSSQMGIMSLTMQQLQKDMASMKDDKAGLSSLGAAGTVSTPALKMPGISMDDPKGDNYECLSSGAKVLKAARSGECVNLVDFAPVLEPTNVTETSLVDGELTFKQKRAVRSMDSFLLWSLAWRGYEEHLVEGDPSLYKRLVDYRIFIQTCAAKYWWQSVYAYDVRNRSKHSMSKSFDFNRVDSDIYVTCMDSSTVRTNVKQCARCRSIWHVTRDCPFPACNEVETGSRSLAQQPSSKTGFVRPGRRYGQQPCFAWNSGRCFSSSCERLHVCQGCGGPDPISRCKNCNSFNKSNMSASASTFTPAGSSNSSGGGYNASSGRVGP